MTIEITADTTLSIEIKLDGQEGFLRLDGGSWYLTLDSGTRWIGSPKISWPDALKRALVRMGAH